VGLTGYHPFYPTVIPFVTTVYVNVSPSETNFGVTTHTHTGGPLVTRSPLRHTGSPGIHPPITAQPGTNISTLKPTYVPSFPLISGTDHGSTSSRAYPGPLILIRPNQPYLNTAQTPPLIRQSRKRAGPIYGLTTDTGASPHATNEGTLPNAYHGTQATHTRATTTTTTRWTLTPGATTSLLPTLATRTTLYTEDRVNPRGYQNVKQTLTCNTTPRQPDTREPTPRAKQSPQRRDPVKTPAYP